MTLLGLVQHMAEVEHNWFQRVFAGQDVHPPLRQRLLLDPGRGAAAQIASVDAAEQPADDTWRALTTRNAVRLLPGLLDAER